MKELIDHWRLVIAACLTLGLSPYFPEPHLWGKLRWLYGGAIGMQSTDYLDLFMHGLPFLLLFRLVLLKYVFHRAFGK
jgi:hypothetical protein